MNSTRVISPKNSTILISPPDCSHIDKSSRLARIEVFVCLVFFLSLVLFPIGIVRRRYNSGVLKAIALGIIAAINLMVPYIFGLLGSSELKHARVYVWIILLLYVYCNTPSSLKFNDSMGGAVAVVKSILYTYYISAFLSEHTYRRITDAGIILIMSASVLKAMETGWVTSIVNANYTRPTDASIRDGEEVDARPPQTAMPTDSIREGQEVDDAPPPQTARPADSIRVSQEVDDAPPPQTARPTDSNDPWIRCKYVVFPVLGVHTQEITIQNIWRSCEEEGCILRSSSDLKSYCLSFSLFHKLRLRFAGCISNQSSRQVDQWNLVQSGLLLDSSYINPFTVVELELALVHDCIHTNILYVCRNRFERIALVKHLVALVGICLLAVPAFEKHHPKEEVPPRFQIQCYGNGRELVITWIVILVSALLELLHFYVFFRPMYSKMLLLRTYLSRKSWTKTNILDGCIQKATQIILRLTNGGGELFKPWQRQLGQYSPLDPCSYSQWINLALLIPNIICGGLFARLCTKQSANVPLSIEIKRAVIQALLARGGQLTNGIATLQDNSNQLPLETKRKLYWACKPIQTDVEVVLIWHIATSLCKMNRKIISPNADDYHMENVRVATRLSNYCAYLVAFAPDMLPGHVPSTNYVCTRTIEEAYKCRKNYTQEHHIYQKFMRLTVKDGVHIQFHDPNTQIDDTSIVQKGAGLGKLLVHEIGDLEIQWKLLADFWAEMILYLAPNAHNEWDHVERLADGGEFITHLWALLFHAGIANRGPLKRATYAEADRLELHQV